MAVQFRLLGSVDAHVNGAPVDLGHARQRSVLAVLLIDANHAVPAEVLLDRVWGDRPPQRARNALAGYVSRLRALFTGIGGVTLGRRSDGYQLNVDEEAVDLHRFRRLVAEARAATDDRTAGKALDEALSQGQGQALAPLDPPWPAAVRRELDAERLAATLDRNDVALRLDGEAELLGELPKLADAHPLDERLAAQFMLALYRCGRQADALRHYEAVRALLADELGVDPGPDLRTLHRRILRADPTLAAGNPAIDTTPVPHQLPASPGSFVGRTREVAELDAALAEPRAEMVILTISGPPGVGKSTLATHLAQRVAHRFADGQQYVNLRGFDPGGAATPPAEALRFLLDSLGVPAQRIPAGVEAQSALYRTLLADRQVLLVLDNARDAEQVRPLLPGGAGCAVVVTSRDALGSLVMADGARPLTLNVLTGDESRELLSARLGRETVDANPVAVADIVARCGGLPLALAIVAARISTHPGLTMAEVVVELGGGAATLEALAEAEPAADLRTVFSWSYAVLGASAARLFRRLGLHLGPDLGVRAAASLDGTPVRAVEAALTELTRAHLVTRVAPNRFSMHDLLRAYAAELARTEDDDATRRAATTRLLDHYLHSGYAAAIALHPHRHRIHLPSPVAGAQVETFGDLDRAFAWFRTEHETLLCVVHLAGRDGFDRHVWQLVWTLTDYLDRNGYWQQKLALNEAALEAALRLDDTQAQAAAHRAIGRALGTLGRFDEAARHLQQALDRYSALGDRAAQGHTHLGLSWALGHQGNNADAIRHDEQALELFSAQGDALGQARALNHLGIHRLELGDHQRALAECRAALALFDRLGDRFGAAATHDSLGQAHQRLGRHDEAVAALERAVQLLRELGERYYEALTLTHLGDVHRDSSRPDAAREAWRCAIAILEELEHPDADGVRARLPA